MTIQLEIRDGNPDWWLSPDIWVVPGADPTAPPGAPIAGQPAYLWAHVANHGRTAADGTRIDFWWADPSTQILRSTANFIGSALVDLPPGGQQDVLCLVPWNVTMVNQGHECLLAVANHAGTSVPNPPPDDFNPPAYPEVAQRNISVLVARTAIPTRLLTVAAGKRTDKASRLTAEQGGQVDQRTLIQLGLGRLAPAKKAKIDVGLGREPMCVPENGALGRQTLDLRVPRGSKAAVHVGIRATGIADGEYGLVRIVETEADRVVGGYSFLVVREAKGGRK
jgi:hypothetical protein